MKKKILFVQPRYTIPKLYEMRAAVYHLGFAYLAAHLPEHWEASFVDEELDDIDFDTLVARVDVIPPSLVLAQAALESGWGTSRFAHEGNAVFGQRSWDEDDGIVPEARRSDETHVVKSFDGLKDSVLAYLVNLNRHGAYRHLRQIRTALHSENLPLDGWTLAAGLDDYAEEPDYIELVRSVIRFNKLTDFDNARLADLAL